MRLPLQLELVDLTKGAQRKPEYLALNPSGRTPTLIDGDFTLWESAAILQYLGDQQATSLWPNDTKARADIMRWQSWHLQHWSRGVNGFVFENLVKSILQIGAPDPKALAQAGELFHQDAAVLDRHLERRPYLVNDALTLADFTVAAPLFLAERAKIPVEKYANIRRWFGTQAALPAWTETAPRS
jgi:glutathione S-transferase